MKTIKHVLRSKGKRKIPPTIKHVLRSKGKRKIPPDTDTCMVNQLPSEIIMDILSRLPTDSILESRQVCKTWGNLIRHPSFVNMHLQHNCPLHSSVTGAKIGLGFLVFFRTAPKECLAYYGEYDKQPNKKLRRLNQPGVGHLSVAGSRNGLICFSDSNFWNSIHKPVYISNPITREYMKFPRLEINGENKVDTMVCGFGYLPSVDQYKIVRIYYIQDQPMGRVQVYTLGGGRRCGWSNIGETAYSIGRMKGFLMYRHNPFGAFANGALHWLDQEQKIVSFDLAEEKFYLLPSPPFVSSVDGRNSFELEVLGGCLCFIHQKQCKPSDIWLLRKKGESSSYDVNEQEFDSLTWVKVLSLPDDAWPFALTSSGEFLIAYMYSIWSYDPKTATAEKFALDDDFCHPVTHMNSFVSLKALGEKCRSRKRYAVNPSPTEYFITQQRKETGEFPVIQF